jgi:hypothetical protein
MRHSWSCVACKAQAAVGQLHWEALSLLIYQPEQSEASI